MANAASTIEIELEIRDAINRLGKLEGELKKSSSAMDRVANSTKKMESAFKSARNAASALFAAISVQQIAQAADTFTRFANQIRIATTSAAEAAAVQKELYQVSQATGTAIEDTTKLYSRLRIAADQLGSSQAETIRITEIVAKSLAAAGTSSTEASGALLQLAQALNSPKVQAEEFNSLIDGMPNLLKEVEKQLGLTAGSLKKFVTDGNLTNQLFKDAILGSADAINEQFGAAQDTIATSFTRLNNSFILLVGNFEKSTGFFNSIASVISTLAENMDELARVLKAVAVGFTIAFAPKVIRAIRDTAAAMTVLGAATKTNVIGALAALGFYIADVTGGLDSLMEKLGLTKDKADETAGAMVDLTKGGGGAGASQSQTYESAFFKETIKNLEGYLTDIEKYGPQITEQIDQMLFDVNRLLDSDSGFVKQTIFGSDEAIPIRQYVTELSKIVEIVEAAIKGQEEYNRLKTKDAQITEEGAALEQKILDAKFAINKAQEELNRLQKIDIYDGILNSLRRFLGIQQDITDETEKQLSNAEKQAKAREQYVNAVGDTIVSGTFGAGPNASRAGQIGQAYGAAGGGIPGLINAAAKLILSNEKVAAAIDKSFEMLFDTLDPVIDLLGDLISAINRLIGALAKGIGDGVQSVLDQAGVGQDSYLFGGGFARDFEQFSYDISGGMFGVNNRPSGMSQEEFSSYNLELWQRASTDVVAELLQDVGNVGFSSIMEGVETEYQKVVERIQSISSDDVSSNQRSQLLNTALEVQITLLQQLRQQYEEISDKETVSLLKEINERGIQRNEIDQIRVNYQKEIQQVSENLLLTEKDQVRVIKALQEAREREIEAIERQQTLSNLQTGGNELQKILNSFEDTFERIIDLVQGLRDQATGLIYGSNSVVPASDRFEAAAIQYQKLLAAALDPDATEENVKDFQDFVDTYLKSAQDVFKSSNRYQNIFNSVLSDLEEIANFVSIAAPINEIESVKAQLIEVAEDFGIGIEEIINGLDQLSRALTFRALVVGVPVQTVIDTTNSDLVIEAIVTAVEDPNLSDTQIEAIVTAAQATGSDTIIEAVVTAVADSRLSNTEIQAIVTAVLGAGSDTQIEAQVSAIASNTPLISAIVDAVAANIPTITADIDLDISGIQSTMEDLAETLQSSIDRLVASLILQDLKVASAGAISSVYSPSYASGIYSSTDTTAGYSVISSSFNPTVTGQDYQGEFNWDDLSANEQFFALYNYQKANDTSFITKPYFVLRQALAGSNFQPYLYAFDQLADAQNYYDLQQYEPGDYAFGKYNLVKYGFRRGGIVDPMDTIPAMLSPGEYILSPETVRRYGVSNLNRLNSGDTAALNATSDPEVKRLLAELIVAVKENDTEVNVYTDMKGQTKASIEEFRSELRERTRRQGDKFLPARYI